MVRPLPLVIVWSVLGLVGALSLARARTPVVEADLFLAIGAAWGALVFAGVRTQALLQSALARKGQAPTADSAPVHRIFPMLLPAVGVGAVAGLAFGGATIAFGTLVPSGVALIVTALALTPPLVLLCLRVFKADLTKERRPRTSSLASWIVVDTALPAALICGPFSAAFAYLRLRTVAVEGVAQPLVDAVSTSRHFALTFVIWGLCVGTAAFMKTKRERMSGLVEAPLATAVVPSPAALGGILAIVVLVVGPRVLEAQAIDDLVVIKGALGVTLGGLMSAFGALRGARDPTETIRPR